MLTTKTQSRIRGQHIALITTLAISLFLAYASYAQAKGQDGGPWNYTYTSEPLYYYWDGNIACGFTGTPCSGWAKGLQNLRVAVNYYADIYNNQTNQLISNGTTIPVGTVLRFAPKAETGEDAMWSGLGYSQDSPNAWWVSSIFPYDTSINACSAANYVGRDTSSGIDVYAPLLIKVPTKTIVHSGTAGLSCNTDNSICTVTSAGSINSTVFFEATTGHFYYAYDQGGGCTMNGGTSYIPGLPPAPTVPMATESVASGAGTNNNVQYFLLNILQQTVTFNLTAAGAGAAPPPPSGTNTSCSYPSYDSPGGSFSCTDCAYVGSEKTFSYHSCDIGPCGPQPTPETYEQAIAELRSTIVSAGDNPSNYSIDVAATSGTCPSPGCDAWFRNDFGTAYACPAPPPPNGAPSIPNITGDTTGTTNTNYPFNVVSTDPGDQVRYGISDAACTVAYEWLPGSGLVNENTAQTFNGSWSTTGPQTLYVFAEDSSMGRSACGTHTITINPTPAPTADLKINNSDGPLDVPKNSAVTLAWSSQNAASCTMFGEGMGQAGTTVTPSGSMPATVTQSGNFVVSCSGAPDQATVNVVNQPPAPPTITHPAGSAAFDTDTTFTITASDPDGDNIFYEIDWDNNGTVDATTQTVLSGQSQAGTRRWNANGPQTFQARTVDAPPGGLRSGWTQYTITIDLPPAPIATLEAAVNGGSFSSGDQTINPGDTVTMRWDSNNASSCDGSGSGFNTSGNTTGIDAVDTPAPNSQTTFTATCSGPGGQGGTSITITTRQLPNFNQPNITYQLSNGFDPATGYYDSVSVTFQTTNNGGSDTRALSDWEFQFDRERNGFEVTNNGPLGLVPVGINSGATETVSGNIPFGNSRVRVFVDLYESVSETNENDNERILDLQIPPPDPGLDITADRTQLREGESTTIRWSRQASYPLDCTVTGPNVLVNDAPREGERDTAAIKAKSVFTFSCIEPITGTEFSDTVSVESAGTIEET